MCNGCKLATRVHHVCCRWCLGCTETYGAELIVMLALTISYRPTPSLPYSPAKPSRFRAGQAVACGHAGGDGAMDDPHGAAGRDGGDAALA